ncbi:MAG: hypothetical protein UW46_C0004G0046 [Candidatus Yanofskybacteria bacterium GW2011_GWF1_44_227]|uniref:N-acetyltransferase domain-containing protein n=1 Tax=Candidatus Yanofskybacteria bacterium GW2011_GWE2_40_11 TaxID=1619033 RepID=A0A0G0TRT3_9BACT|nr:MAG: hypothetical protein UT75_C0007G0020 [Candidatus Yanofskybacteria bacterium GW2011_GWE2_40_11]KKT15632.1 MAG: hypothetical protein UV97_C0004G0048 [Candidatus Yanofskybacteria bacterium GW2011_GWF2_43_596]KKT53319.1 MAG: hypothetical protein UW46_C0004G0046 [Candidatus Yanofskybacteria bacterium GW2011_GWF1_44_227]OGN35949.1 MAG: hypothetical protein A2207_02725 [Candidatus Yanofskybacteria bacterium RIFOXYA1_FULL_44_17]OGN36449.1 MAG: hypothetical protein A2241_01760 [Candidatus Yanofs
MIIRIAQEKDLGDIKEIYSLYYDDQKDLEHFLNRVREAINRSDIAQQWDFHYLVAEIDNRVLGLIGFCKPLKKLLSFTKTSRPVELYSLFVKEKFKGIGRPLLEEMTKQVKEAGYTEIVVYSDEKWSDSWGFYDKLGFARVGKLDVSGNGQVWTIALN